MEIIWIVIVIYFAVLFGLIGFMAYRCMEKKPKMKYNGKKFGHAFTDTTL